MAKRRSNGRDGPPPVDRLSELPDSILHAILNNLPFDDVVRTSVLSRRWRQVWCTNPVQKISGFLSRSSLDCAVLAAAIDCCLLQCAGLVKLSYLMLCLPEPFPISDHWVSFAACRNVDALFLCGSNSEDYEDLFEVPQSLFWCRSLRSLDIYAANLPVPSLIPGLTSCGKLSLFPLMSSICLQEIGGESKELDFLLSCCPRLESLEIVGCWMTGNFVLSSSTLTRLFMVETSDFSLIKIQSAQQLKSLHLHNDLTEVTLAADAVPQLDTATLFSILSFPNSWEWCQFILKFRHVRVFSVNKWFTMFMLNGSSLLQAQCQMFTNVKEFHYCDYSLNLKELYVLIVNLTCFPSLEKLFLHCNHREVASNTVYSSFANRYGSFGNTDDVDYEFSQLKKVIITGFSGEIEVLKFIRFFMSRSVILNSVIIYYTKLGKNEMDVISKDIESFNRASSTLQLCFSENPRPKCNAHDRS